MWLPSPAGGWGRRVGRWLGPASGAWFLREDEEMLVLAQTDQPSPPDGEEASRAGPTQNRPAGADGETQPRRHGLGRACGEATGENAGSEGATGGNGRGGETQRTPQSGPEPLTQRPPTSAGPRITTWEAGWNVTNAIQGVFVLSLPHALLQSGYLGLLLLPLAAALCNYTGRVLVSCLYEEDEGGRPVRVRSSYSDVADACCRDLCPRRCPHLGGALVDLAQLTELVVTCALYLAVGADLLESALPPASAGSGSASGRLRPLGALLALVPCLLLADLRAVSRLSMLCSLPQLMTTVVVVVHCLGSAGRWDWGALALAAAGGPGRGGDPGGGLPGAAGAIIFSYTSQVFLPALEGSMENRQDFSLMLRWTHGVAGVLKTLFSLVSLLTWGASTREVITDNLPPRLQTLVNLCLLAKALLSYPLPFYAAAELLLAGPREGGGATRGGEGAGPVVVGLAEGGGVPEREGAAPPNSDAGVEACGVIDAAEEEAGLRGPRGVALRGGLLLLTFLLARLASPRVSPLMGLTGSVTGVAVSLVLPCAFHLRLRWAGLGGATRALDLVVVAMGSLCGLSGLVCAVRGLVGAAGEG